MDEMDRAHSLYQRIQRADYPIAVFYAGGSFRSLRADSAFWTSVRGQDLRRLVGIYDQRVKEEWLIDDLTYMSARQT